MYPQQRHRPDKHTDRLAWEASWENDLNAFYNRPLQDLRRPAREPPSSQALSLLGTSSHLLHQEQKTREICSLQSDIARAVVPAYVSDGFEYRWKALTSEKRREVVLEGLYRASCVAWLEDRRGLCPDITLSSLSGRGDNDEYLRLLKTILPSTPLADDATIPSPIYIPHPKIDHIWALPRGEQQNLPGLKAWIRDIRLDRVYFASMALRNIFLAFHGAFEQYAVARAPNQTPEEYKQLKKTVDKTIGKDKFKEMPVEYRRLQREQVKVCWHCGILESSLKFDKRLRACGKCLTVDRKIWYCSRECQIKNWKHGVPTPHRDICGKQLVADHEPRPSERPSSDDSSPQIPEPDPSFRRSPDLLHQISFLLKPPYVDYTFVFPSPHPDQGVTVFPLEDRATFLALRDIAFHSGDPSAVQMMYFMLLPFAAGIGFSSSSLKQQLEREYCIELYDSGSEWEAATTLNDQRTQRDDIAHNTDESTGLDPRRRGNLSGKGARIHLPGIVQPAAPEPRNVRTALEKLAIACMYYLSFTFLSLCIMHSAIKFLLRNPLMLIVVAPFLGYGLKALAGAFRYGNEWVWKE